MLSSTMTCPLEVYITKSAVELFQPLLRKVIHVSPFIICDMTRRKHVGVIDTSFHCMQLTCFNVVLKLPYIFIQKSLLQNSRWKLVLPAATKEKHYIHTYTHEPSLILFFLILCQHIGLSAGFHSFFELVSFPLLLKR
jgi:hypothetical protein